MMALYWSAMYVSQIWYAGYTTDHVGKHPGWRTYCRARAVVLFDRIIAGRVQVES